MGITDVPSSFQQWVRGVKGGSSHAKRLPTLAEVAEFAVFVASDRASAMTGAIANLTCGSLVD
jgi:3-oxoacyl-[acyl-carrier protein] reductase